MLETSGIVNILDSNGKGKGTGFLYSSSGRIATCYHVVKKSLNLSDEDNYANEIKGRKIKICQSGSNVQEYASIIFVSPIDDIAILQMQDVNDKIHYRLNAETLNYGQTLSTCGFYQSSADAGYEEVIVLGIVSDSGQQRIQLESSKAIPGGFSGGPVFDPVNGEVVGIFTKSSTEESNLYKALAIPSTVVVCMDEKTSVRENASISSRGIGNYLQHIKQKTNSLEFKGIENLAYIKGKSTTLSLYATLFVREQVKEFGLSYVDTKLEEVVNNSRGIIIKGNPGSGKSTFIKYYVRSELERQLNESVLPEDKIVPFIIALDNFAKFLEKQENISDGQAAVSIFVRYLLTKYPQNGFSFTNDGLLKILENGRCWIFFDGFDEIDSFASKQTVLSTIDFLFEYFSLCKFLVTSRPYAIEEFRNYLKEFQVEYIDELHEADIERYIKTLAKLCKTDEKAVDENGLINTIRNNAYVYELAKTPVMLTFICIIYFTKNNIPDNRLEIIDKTITWLISTAFSSVDDQEWWMDHFTKIAFNMIHGTGKVQIEISEDDLYQLYNKKGKKRDLINILTNTGIIIKSSRNKYYTFWHFCFEEYLAAKKLCKDELTSHSSSEIIISHWFDKEWHEVIVLFFAALLQESDNVFINCFDNICKHLLTLDTSYQIKGTSLLGNILKEVYPNTVPLNNSESWKALKSNIEIVFSKVPNGVTYQELSNAATVYGLSHDDRFDDFDKTFIKLQGGFFYFGSQCSRHCGRKYDPLSTEFEQPVKEIFLPEFEIRKYPITVEEYERFINNDGYRASKEIWSEGGFEWRISNKITMPRNWRSQLHLRNSPVTGVSWFEAVAFCNWITLYSEDYRYKLPTEGQWEFAFFTCHDQPALFNRHFNYYSDENDIQHKTPVGLLPFPFESTELKDMLGNVEELCEDSWNPSLIAYPTDGTAYSNKNEMGKVTRGGSTIRTKRLCRPTYRARCNKDTRYDTIGFRVVRIRLK